MRLVMAAAGLGTRTKNQFEEPKPFIPIGDKTLIELVSDQMPWAQISETLFVFNKMHRPWFSPTIEARLANATKGSGSHSYDFIDSTTGQAETVAAALGKVDDLSIPLLVANCDTLVSGPWPDFTSFRGGGIGVFRSSNPNLSFVRLGEDGDVEETAEKKPISDYATSGFYYFASSKLFLDSLVSHEYESECYIAPLYNELVAEGVDVKTWNHESVVPLGTDTEIMQYLERSEVGR